MGQSSNERDKDIQQASLDDSDTSNNNIVRLLTTSIYCEKRRRKIS